MNRYTIFFKQGDGLILEGIQNVINILNLHTKIIDGTMKIVSDKKGVLYVLQDRRLLIGRRFERLYLVG